MKIPNRLIFGVLICSGRGSRIFDLSLKTILFQDFTNVNQKNN